MTFKKEVLMTTEVAAGTRRRWVHASSNECLGGCVYMYFCTPSAWGRHDTRLIFKQSLSDLNSEFSF